MSYQETGPILAICCHRFFHYAGMGGRISAWHYPCKLSKCRHKRGGTGRLPLLQRYFPHYFPLRDYITQRDAG